MQNVYRLLIWCPDRRGIIAAVTSFLARHGANILDADQHTDADDGSFFMRLEFEGRVDLDAVGWPALAGEYGMEWKLAEAGRKKRMAVLVSKQDHCLQDLLWRTSIGEWHAEIACVISNHPDCGALVATHGLHYHLLPVTPQNKAQQEQRLLAILAEAKADLVVLARYMQVLSAAVTEPWANRIINIHHSFLPAFSGGRPYHQAHERGVKLIGATAHYVTPELDAGPILAQATTGVNHRDRIDDLVRKGRDLERTTLAAAVRAHLADRVLVHAGRTVVFD
ncbi:MAG: formyltetrahydrofolate deformylase [Phycisphaerae bacterium]